MMMMINNKEKLEERKIRSKRNGIGGKYSDCFFFWKLNVHFFYLVIIVIILYWIKPCFMLDNLQLNKIFKLSSIYIYLFIPKNHGTHTILKNNNNNFRKLTDLKSTACTSHQFRSTTIYWVLTTGESCLGLGIEDE